MASVDGVADCGNKPHPWYGPCDALGPNGECAECIKVRDLGETSDGYHTFNELYEHRHALWLAVCRFWSGYSGVVWRSQKHADGTRYEGWFVLGMHKASGAQITYHLPMRLWDQASFADTIKRAPEFDGHTPADVLERIGRL